MSTQAALSTLGQDGAGQDPLADPLADPSMSSVGSSAQAPRVAAAGPRAAAASSLKRAASAHPATASGLSRKERGELVKLEHNAGLSSSVMISDDGSSSAKFDHFLHHFDVVGAQVAPCGTAPTLQALISALKALTSTLKALTCASNMRLHFHTAVSCVLRPRMRLALSCVWHARTGQSEGLVRIGGPICWPPGMRGLLSVTAGPRFKLRGRPFNG